MELKLQLCVGEMFIARPGASTTSSTSQLGVCGEGETAKMKRMRRMLERE
jgi:hypothetical protein